MTSADLLFENGRVFPRPGDGEAVDAVVFQGNRVAALGADAERSATTGTRRIDLEGRTILPGFNDAHAHVMWVGLRALESDLSPATRREMALSMLAENAANTDEGGWVIGFGYDESTWPTSERTYLSRTELDAVSDHHPIVAQRVDGHVMSLNSAAIERVDLDGVSADLELGPDGEPTGVVVEAAVGRVRDHLSPDREKGRLALSAAVERAHELGLTSVQTMAGLSAETGGPDPTLRAAFAAWRESDLPIRLSLWTAPTYLPAITEIGLPIGFGDDRLRLAGTKQFSDGSIGGRTAKLAGSYADAPETDGEFVTAFSGFEATARTAANADLPVATHAIGGPAIDTVIDVYANTLPAYETDAPLLRIEHVELATDEALTRMAGLGIVASMQPNYLQWSRPGGLYEARLGTDRLGTDNRFRDVLDASVPLAFGSDNMPFGPLYGIHHAVNAPYDTQRLSVAEAIEAYTLGAAKAERTADHKGTLEPGKLADAVVLARDPFEYPSAIDEIEVEMTVLGGEVVYGECTATTGL